MQYNQALINQVVRWEITSTLTPKRKFIIITSNHTNYGHFRQFIILLLFLTSEKLIIVLLITRPGHVIRIGRCPYREIDGVSKCQGSSIHHYEETGEGGFQSNDITYELVHTTNSKVHAIQTNLFLFYIVCLKKRAVSTVECLQSNSTGGPASEKPP